MHAIQMPGSKDLNVVARRDIQPGEQITLDYAMLYGEEMPLFECHCDSPTCRGIIRGRITLSRL